MDPSLSGGERSPCKMERARVDSSSVEVQARRYIITIESSSARMVGSAYPLLAT